MVRTSIALVLGFLALGCGESSATKQIRTAAAVDLSCEEVNIRFLEDKPLQKRVDGCGRQMTYMYRCRTATNYGASECRWAPVRDSRDEQ